MASFQEVQDSSAANEGSIYETGYLSRTVSVDSIDGLTNLTEEELIQKLSNLDMATFTTPLLEAFDAKVAEGEMNLESFKQFFWEQLQPVLLPYLVAFAANVTGFDDLCYEFEVFPDTEEGEQKKKDFFVGTLSHLEFTAPIITSGLFRIFDKEDNNGVITRHEFLLTLVTVALMSKYTGDGPPLEFFKTLFELVDSNNNNRVETKEISDFILEILNIPFSLPRPLLTAIESLMESPAIDLFMKEGIWKDLECDSYGLQEFKEKVKKTFEIDSAAMDAFEGKINEYLPTEQLVDQFIGEFASAASSTNGSLPIDCTVDLYTRVAHQQVTKLINQYRPMLLEQIGGIAEAFPFDTEQVTSLLQLVLEHALSLIRGPGVRRCVTACMVLLDNNNNGQIKEADVRAIFKGTENGSGNFSDRLDAVIRMFDADDDGKVTKEEAKVVFSKVLKCLMELVLVSVDIVKEIIFATLFPIVGLAASMVGDGTSFTFEEVLSGMRSEEFSEVLWDVDDVGQLIFDFF